MASRGFARLVLARRSTGSNRWIPNNTGRVSRVEHHLGGVAPAPDPQWDEYKPSPSLIVVMEVERPEDREMDKAVADFEAQD
jgi:hypothetical protein